jgi:N utilization substance protein B
MSEAGEVSRRQARRDAMVVLYQHDVTGREPEQLFEGLERERGYPTAEFTRLLVDGVLAQAAELDCAIDRASPDWPAHRLAALERNILRIAVYEMMHRQDIPAEVSIDEAVALAKRFCSREAGSLVNGILANVAGEDAGSGKEADHGRDE